MSEFHTFQSLCLTSWLVWPPDLCRPMCETDCVSSLCPPMPPHSLTPRLPHWLTTLTHRLLCLPACLPVTCWAQGLWSPGSWPKWKVTEPVPAAPNAKIWLLFFAFLWSSSVLCTDYAAWQAPDLKCGRLISQRSPSCHRCPLMRGILFQIQSTLDV